MSGRAPREHRFSATAGEICWFEWGEAGHGPTLLLLHATGFHARCWDGMIGHLPADLHIIAPDTRGHGRSFKPAALTDWSAAAGDLAELVAAHVPGPIVGVGHSMGGCCLATIAARLPERFARLVLVDPVIMEPTLYQGAPHDGAVEDHPVARRRNRWASVEEMIARFADRPPYAHWRPDVLADYCTHGLLPAPDGDGLVLACPPVVEASVYQSSTAFNPYPQLVHVTCPVTVLRAKRAERESALDFSVSPTAPDLATHFVQGRDLHWADVSHFIPMDVPERLASLVAEELRAAG